MKHIFKNAIMISAAFAAASCTANYLDINSNPFEVSRDEMQADGYGMSAALNGMASVVISTDVNTAQMTDCLLGGTQGGYFGDTGAWAYTISNFNATDDWTRVFMASDEIIPRFYSSYIDLKRITDDPVPLAIADIMKVATMHRVADTYGPVPYSRIGMDGKITVPYDSQRDAYMSMYAELCNAVDTLTKYRSVSIPSTADYVYGGNVEKWAKFGNSLKLRLALRVSVADPDLAGKMASSAVAGEVGLLASNEDNALMSSLGKDGNSIYKAVWYNPVQAQDHPDGKPCKTGGESHASADITSYMNAYNDPRRDKYFIPSEFEKPEHRFCGIRRGIVRPDLKEKGHLFSGILMGPDEPIMWMNASEVAFLKAEAAARGLIEGDAGQFYNEGIRLSFEMYGAEGYDSYIAQEEEVSVTYEDPTGDNSYQGVLATLPVKWNEGAGLEEKIERIMIQKWIANWKLGNEAWADYRRTGYPHLIPASDAGNMSNGIVDSSRGARRMPYPQAEYTTNYENITAALTMLGGQDNMATDVWFAKKK